MVKFKFLIILYSIFCVHSLFAQQDIKEYRVATNIYMVGDRVYSLYYITKDAVVIIDPIDARIASATLQSIRKHTDLPVKYVIYSHNHWDHIKGGQVFKDNFENVKFLMHENAFENLAPNDEVVIPNEVWNGRFYSLEIGKIQIELYHYGQNHGHGMTVFRFPEHNAAFVVDLVVPDRILYTYLPDAKPKYWLEDLHEIDKLEFDDLYMAHVRPLGSRKDLKLQIQYFEDLYAATEKALQDGVPFFEIPNSIDLPEYKEWLFYKEWLHMNVWRILMEKSTGQ